MVVDKKVLRSMHHTLNTLDSRTRCILSDSADRQRYMYVAIMNVSSSTLAIPLAVGPAMHSVHTDLSLQHTPGTTTYFLHLSISDISHSSSFLCFCFTPKVSPVFNHSLSSSVLSLPNASFLCGYLPNLSITSL